ncbi:hypothetical protein J6590_082744 [Homalodisca vitripennis]|nr:hypothetical protein J6590_082744 [Homalodisca vitripennis]
MRDGSRGSQRRKDWEMRESSKYSASLSKASAHAMEPPLHRSRSSVSDGIQPDDRRIVIGAV